jgi:hypothetical protein
MRRHRTTALGIVGSLLIATVAAVLATTPARGGANGALPRLVFPLVAKTDLWDNYGDPRPNEGTPGSTWRTPWHASRRGRGRTGPCAVGLGGCMLYLYGRSGTMYSHPPEQRPHREERQPRGAASDVTFYGADGAGHAGQQIAWVGDPADATGPHLHFEVHPNGGSDIDPSSTSPAPEAALRRAEGRRRVRGRLGRRGTASVERVRRRGWLGVDPRSVELTAPSARRSRQWDR